MTIDERRDGLIKDALNELLSMAPDRLESAERRIREATGTIGQINREGLIRLRLTHAAAVQAAQLWRGCIPQDGYSAMGPTQPGSVGTSLCVTG